VRASCSTLLAGFIFGSLMLAQKGVSYYPQSGPYCPCTWNSWWWAGCVQFCDGVLRSGFLRVMAAAVLVGRELTWPRSSTHQRRRTSGGPRAAWAPKGPACRQDSRGCGDGLLLSFSAPGGALKPSQESERSLEDENRSGPTGPLLYALGGCYTFSSPSSKPAALSNGLAALIEPNSR